MVDLERCGSDAPSPDSCLADYHAAVERLRTETVDELGRQPMAPEMASMIAVLLAALPIVVALHPANPLTLEVWQVATILAAVWAGAFLAQRTRYDRFHAAWSRKVADHGSTPLVIPVSDFRYRRSGQTTGAWAAENRRVSITSPSSIARTISSRPARTTSPRIERPSSSQTSREPSTQRHGASR